MVYHGKDSTAVWGATCLCGDIFTSVEQLDEHVLSVPEMDLDNLPVYEKSEVAVPDRRPAKRKLKENIARLYWLRSLTPAETEELGMDEKDYRMEIYLCNKAILDHNTVT